MTWTRFSARTPGAYPSGETSNSITAARCETVAREDRVVFRGVSSLARVPRCASVPRAAWPGWRRATGRSAASRWLCSGQSPWGRHAGHRGQLGQAACAAVSLWVTARC
jgi:hypothetical protein